MTDAVQQLLANFEQLPPVEQRMFFNELKGRIQRRERDFNLEELTDDEHAALADRLFLMYEDEEGRNA